MTEPIKPTRERVTVKLRDVPETEKAPEPKPDKKLKEQPNA